jgi:hypothetical protein
MYLVSCVSAKESTPLPARDLYCSDWFVKARGYVEAQGQRWFILSAKYGLVEPDDVIAPYEKTLKGMSSARRRRWAELVAGQLRPRCRPGVKIVFLAGQAYREYLVPLLCEWGCQIRVPMEGLFIGEQKAWLKRQLRRLA